MRRIQKKGERYRTQCVNPVTRRRMSLVGDSEDQVRGKLADVRQTRDLLRAGAIKLDEARRRLAATAHGSLMLVTAWERYRESRTGDDWKNRCDQYWENHVAVPVKGRPFEGSAVLEMTPLWMTAWLVTRQEARSGHTRRALAPKTIWNVFDALRACVNLYVDEGLLDRLPWGSWTPPARQRDQETREALRTEEEFVALLRAAYREDGATVERGDYADLAYRIAVMVLLGLRTAELSALGWQDFRSEEEVLIRFQVKPGWKARHPEWERPSDPTKYRKKRDLSVSPAAIAVLALQRENLVKRGWYREDGPVFPAARTGDWRTSSVAIHPEVIRRLARSIGLGRVEEWVTHSMRHSFGTIEANLAGGGDLKAIMRAMGHGSLQVTQGYIHSRARGLPGSTFGALALALPPSPRSDVDEGDVRLAEPRAPRLPEPPRPSRKARFRAAFVAWDEAGRSGVRPAAVTAEADAAYRLARVRAERSATKTGTPADQVEARRSAAGKRARGVVLGAWKRFLAPLDAPKTARPTETAAEP